MKWNKKDFMFDAGMQPEREESLLFLLWTCISSIRIGTMETVLKRLQTIQIDKTKI